MIEICPYCGKNVAPHPTTDRYIIPGTIIAAHKKCRDEAIENARRIVPHMVKNYGRGKHDS